MPGVLAVLTGADVKADGLKDVPHTPIPSKPPADILLTNRDGSAHGYAPQELLPTDRQLPTLLRKITLAGQQTGVTFTMFRPGGMKPSDFHTEMPISVAVSGDYHAVGSFLAELSNMRRIVTVSNLKLTTNNKNDGGGSTIAEFTASAYSLNTAPAPARVDDTKKGDKNGRKI